MQKLKTIMVITGAVLLFILGALLGGTSNRRRIHRAEANPIDPRPDLDGAGDTNRAAGDEIDNSTELNKDIRAANTVGQRLVRRGLDILETAKNRDSSSGG